MMISSTQHDQVTTIGAGMQQEVGLRPFMLTLTRGQDVDAFEARGHGFAMTGTGREINVEVSLPSGNLIYFHRNGEGTVRITNDLRQLRALEHLELSQEGFGLYMMLGNVPPPLSLFKGIVALEPGYTHRFDTKTQSHSKHLLTRRERPGGVSIEDHVWSVLSREAGDREVPENILLFSGGIDSSLIACILASQASESTTLLHMTQEEKGEETTAAAAIAQRLGLRMEIVPWKEEGPENLLASCAQVYRYPFGDHASVPMYQLITGGHLGSPNHVQVLDGEGADDLFAVAQKVRSFGRLHQVSSLLAPPLWRLLYRRFYWHQRSTAEYLARLVVRAHYLPPELGIMTNALFTALYEQGDNFRERYEEVGRWLSDQVNQDHVYERTVVLATQVLSASVTAQKMRQPLAHLGYSSVSPFLSSDLMSVALRLDQSLPPKWHLKELLRRDLPAPLIDRPKYGFHAPQEQLFGSTYISEAVQRVLMDERFEGLVSREVLSEAAGRLRRGESVQFQLYNAIWNLLFLQAWLR